MSANRATENSATGDEASDVDSESSGNTAVDSSGSDSEDIVINPSWANNTNGLRQIPFTGNNRLLVDVPENGNETDCLAKVKLIVDHFNNKMDEVYYPCKELSLDEAMVLWRGRLVFR
ncbi:hypothetical protein J6590_099813 [Homalodisca vitripennis]|nr:hypothetical protein J6590_099813 [Homalodisca vitripennis]